MAPAPTTWRSAFPPGTVVIDSAGDFVLKDLSAPGDQLVAARGGRGGKGNARFKSSTNQAPRQHTPGGESEKRRLTFELKMIADVGLLGKPNAGKSSPAEPRLASPAGDRRLSPSRPKSPTSASCKSTSIAPWSWPTYRA